MTEKMKPSRIGWIKDIPESWKTSKCEFQSNGVPVPEERCAHSNANGVAVPF